MELDISKLNKEQKQAVTFEQGPVLIVAGAGTGKTTVITNRLAYLIQNKKAKPEEILALTFTNKAAQEMEERVDRLLPYGYIDLWISTFHSFCNRILKENALDIGLSADFKLLDETAAWLLIKQNFDRFKLNYYKPRSTPFKFINALVSHFSRCKDQGIYPEDYLEYSKKVEGEDEERIKELAEAYQSYQKLLLENNSLDFGDLINYCLELFRKRPLILKRYREQFKYILVDEFQDTNWSQYELLKILAVPKNNLFVSSDDDQSIFKFRGASFSNILQFRKDYPEAKEIVLVDNYRSCQNILDSAYKFIQLNNPNRLEYVSKVNKRLLADYKGKGIIEHLHFNTIEQELDSVINKIIELMNQDKELTFNDFAVLTRINETANAFARNCERNNIPYQFLASKGLYSKPVILDIISYFKLLDNHYESSSVYRVLSIPALKIPHEDIAKITHYSYKKFKSVYETLQELPLVEGLSQKSVNKINNLLDLIKKHTQLSSEKNVSKVLLYFLEDSGYLKYLTKLDKKENFDFLNQFFKKIKNFEESSNDPLLKGFIEEVNLELEAGEQGKIDFDPEQGPEVVRIMTVHTAKGLEFKYVFLISLVDRKFPTTNRKELIEIPEELVKDIVPKGDMHLEEERRLFYVGMTRTKKGLFLTSADDYGGKQAKKLSRFLIELGYNKEITKADKKIKLESKEQKTKSRFILPNYFSFTQLSNFRDCPLKYKFSYILRIPTKGKAVFSFGRTMHNTLFDFVGQYSDKKTNFQDLLKIYKKRWIDEWYENKSQKEEYYKTGQESLKNFYDDFLEKKSSVLLISGQPALEQKFNLKIGGYTINGAIDRIDKLDDGVEIIDYKTGSAKEKLKDDDKEQLLIYQIAAEQVFNLNPKKLTYYYLDQGKEIPFLGTEQDKEKLKEKIISQIKEIKKSNFNPTSGWQCAWCDFKNICEFARTIK